MNNKNLYNKVFAIFGTVMVFFYFGLGAFIIFSPMLDNYMDKGLRIVFGIPIILYGFYRVLTSYEKIKESFFSNDNDED
jgi:cytochrome c biogenesis protein CcdA